MPEPPRPRPHVRPRRPSTTAAAVQAAVGVRPALWAKLSPNVDRPGRRSPPPRARPGRRGGHAGQHGAGHGHRPRDAPARVLGGGGGGLSGPAIHPVAVRAVHDVHRDLPDLPIVGVGRRGDRASTPSSCCWPARRRCRSARRPSPIPAASHGCATRWRTGAGATVSGPSVS